MNKILLCLMFLFVFSAKSAEVDNFFLRGKGELPDQSDIVNQKTQEFLKEAVFRANGYRVSWYKKETKRRRFTRRNKKYFCNSDYEGARNHLYKTLRKYFRNHMTGRFNIWLNTTDEVKRDHPLVKDTIYGDWTFFESFPINLLAPKVHRKAYAIMAGQVRIGDALVGTDKFEHFMGTGYQYFEAFYLEGKDIAETSKIGWADETGKLGANTIGVMSFGDIAAEFNGMFFWNHMVPRKRYLVRKYHSIKRRLGKRIPQTKDYIKRRTWDLGPYITCEGDEWVISKSQKINWRNYMNPSMDEAINCSRMGGKSFTGTDRWAKARGMVAKVQERIKERGLKCPVSDSEFNKMKKLYGKYSKYLLNLNQDILPMNDAIQEEYWDANGI